MHLLLDALLPIVEVPLAPNASLILTITAHLCLDIVLSKVVESFSDLGSHLLRVELVDMEVGRLEPRFNLGRIGIGASLLSRRLLLLRSVYG